jgi:hypothetical protein
MGKIKILEAVLAIISAVVATVKAVVKFASYDWKKKDGSDESAATA